MTSGNATPMAIATFETKMNFRHRSATSASSSSRASISEISSIGSFSAIKAGSARVIHAIIPDRLWRAVHSITPMLERDWEPCTIWPVCHATLLRARTSRTDNVSRRCRAGRWPPAAPALLGDPHDRARPYDVRDGRRDSEYRVTDNRARPQCVAIILDLDRQRLSARDHDLAFATGITRRDRRLSPHLLGGLLLFTLASLFCALAHTLILLTIARIVQGFGAAGIMSVNAALVRFTYPRDQLGRGIGINAVVVAVSAAVGPTIAAGILSIASWPYLFAVNVPIGIVTLALGWHFLPHTRPAAHAFDWQSAGLSAIAFGIGIAAIDSIGHGEPPAHYVLLFAIAALAGVVLIHRETHMSAPPLLPLDLLRIPVL